MARVRGIWELKAMYRLRLPWLALNDLANRGLRSQHENKAHANRVGGAVEMAVRTKDDPRFRTGGTATQTYQITQVLDLVYRATAEAARGGCAIHEVAFYGDSRLRIFPVARRKYLVGLALYLRRE